MWGVDEYEIQLEHAFDSFSMWCRDNRKTSTIHEFSKKELKITSFLGLFSKGPFYSQEFSVAFAMHALVSF